MSCKRSDHTLEAHQIVSLSSARSSVPHPRNSDKNTRLLPRLGGGRILKTNKQRIDLLRRIAEVLITSDPSPPLSESASRSSPGPSSIYDFTLILTHPFSSFSGLPRQHRGTQNSKPIMSLAVKKFPLKLILERWITRFQTSEISLLFIAWESDLCYVREWLRWVKAPIC